MKRISRLSSYFKRILRYFGEVMCHLHLIFFFSFFSFHNIHPIDMNEWINGKWFSNYKQKDSFCNCVVFDWYSKNSLFSQFLFLTSLLNKTISNLIHLKYSFSFVLNLLTNCCFDFEFSRLFCFIWIIFASVFDIENKERNFLWITKNLKNVL